MSIQRVILFCSTTSRSSMPCINFAYQNRLPVEIVRLDTEETRERVKHGRYFQIKVVPSLVVFRSQGDLQLFTGQKKVLMWLQSINNNRRNPSRQSTPIHTPEFVEESSDDETSGMYDPIPSKRTKSRRKKSKRPSKQVIQDSEESEDEEVEIEILSEPDSDEGIDGRLPSHGEPSPKDSEVSIKEIAKQMERERKNSMERDRKNSEQYRNDS